VVALAGERDRRRLVAWVVPERGQRAGAEALAGWLAERLPEPMVPADFVELDFLPLTANGKVDRAALPEPDRSAPAAAHQAPRDEVERILAGIWKAVLRVESVGVHDNFFRLGGDSILGVQVIARAHEAGLRLTSRQLFDHQTIAELAAVAGAAERTAAEQGAVTGEVPLTPIQRWFFDLGLERPHHFNQPLLLGLRRPVPAPRLAAALARLLEHHDALRLRFARGEDGAWRQWNAPPGGRPPFTEVDLSALPAGRRAAARAAVAAAAAASLDLERGPVVRLLLLDDGDGPGRLLVVPHHLVMDGVSSRLLVDDLRTLLGGAGEPAALPLKTTSYRRWAESLARRAAGGTHDGELEHWTAAARAAAAPLPVDRPGGADDVAHQRSVPVWLEEDETRELIQEVPRAYDTRINEVLLTCLAATLAEWTGSRRLLVDVESHGRGDVDEGLDVSRTVGWFTAFFPVLLEVDAGADLGVTLKAVKEQLRAVPRDGIGHGVLRWLHPHPEVRRKLADLPAAEIIFNYLGQFDQGGGEDPLFALLRESAGPARDPRGARAHRMAINGRVLGGRLVLEWTYSKGRHRRETVEALAAAFLDRLRALVEHCRAAAAGGYTPADFPLAAVGQEELDRALSEVELEE
jgi:non-ribosomal peptide synthase protein (TIGR01720 family)